IGTLFAFVLVSIGVIILRYKEPNRHRGFRAPGGLLAPIASVFFCGLLMMGLPILTWLRFFGWLAIGLGVYSIYGLYNSELSKKSAYHISPRLHSYPRKEAMSNIDSICAAKDPVSPS